MSKQKWLPSLCPNLEIAPTGRDNKVFGLWEEAAIMLGDDERVDAVHAWSKPSDIILQSFLDPYGDHYIPAILIVRSDWQARLGRYATPVIAS